MKKSQLRLWVGLVCLLPILLQKNLMGILIQALYVIVLAVSNRKSFKLLPNLILLAGVATAHLLQPNGLQLAHIWGFPITLGALLLGLRKALVLIALLYLSQYMIASRPQLPGKLGQLVSLQLYYFSTITTTWATIHPKRPFIKAIDQLMEGMEDNEQKKEMAPKEELASPATLALGGLHILVLWSLFILGQVNVLPL